ncbi:MAG: hypothetical protein FWG85_07910 [Bacteroidetes bacterium]|nr:hypothetical protein [Bacteroidota bacterium]
MKRRIVAILLLISLIMLPLSGIYIHLNHDNYHLSHHWLHFHVFIGVVFVICGILHIIWNWKALKRYLTGK